jgi:hypothetical protein
MVERVVRRQVLAAAKVTRPAKQRRLEVIAELRPLSFELDGPPDGCGSSYLFDVKKFCISKEEKGYYLFSIRTAQGTLTVSLRPHELDALGKQIVNMVKTQAAEVVLVPHRSRGFTQGRVTDFHDCSIEFGTPVPVWGGGREVIP